MSRRALLVARAALCVAGAASARIDLEKDLRGNASSAASGARYKCGALHTATEACYPLATAGSWMSSAKAACSTACTKGFTCNCPVKGESCSSIMVSNPGLKFMGQSDYMSYYAVRVNMETREWEYLRASKPQWSADNMRRTTHFEWAKPSETGASYLESTELVITPSGEDFCQPGVAARYSDNLYRTVGKAERSPWG
ncbi:unnamed protein product [Prorocentrum cordatum]|uniref:Uncharacterized protein n=1 Tax=Prorocentrum cordatum TaxID=2364126 RepID=A0ABN9X5B2_9DINO|nr:unnamed protein product [Polarella glacialis]|mmetsp:Transcript_195/g.612  ORF Transcript_195/g.612 Transcript_195/m.612 type:complete len:198 (+) Transcript_195:108-701(+)